MASAGIAVGARVRVQFGSFKGRVGVVHELDGKGGAKVLLGFLMMRLEVGHLSLEALEALDDRFARPPIESSHRRGE
ncbi:MAG: hypothetical protein NVS3B20_22120 [Polyangiales bacterium]